MNHQRKMTQPTITVATKLSLSLTQLFVFYLHFDLLVSFQSVDINCSAERNQDVRIYWVIERVVAFGKLK